MVYESDFYTTRRPYSRPSPTISSYSVTTDLDPTISKAQPYHRHLPFVAHKRMTSPQAPPPRSKVRNSVLMAEIDRINHRVRPHPAYVPTEDWLNSACSVVQPYPQFSSSKLMRFVVLPLSYKMKNLDSAVPARFRYTYKDNFDDETRSIRAQTAALLKRVHSPIPRSRGPLHAVLPTPSSLMETPVPHRHTSDHYIEGLLAPISKVQRDVTSRSFYVEHPRPYIGKGHLACVSFAGGRAYAKRRNHYDVPEDHHNVQDDIATLSYYNRARAVANGQEPGPEPAATSARKSRTYRSATDSAPAPKVEPAATPAATPAAAPAARPAASPIRQASVKEDPAAEAAAEAELAAETNAEPAPATNGVADDEAARLAEEEAELERQLEAELRAEMEAKEAKKAKKAAAKKAADEAEAKRQADEAQKAAEEAAALKAAEEAAAAEKAAEEAAAQKAAEEEAAAAAAAEAEAAEEAAKKAAEEEAELERLVAAELEAERLAAEAKKAEEEQAAAEAVQEDQEVSNEQEVEAEPEAEAEVATEEAEPEPEPTPEPADDPEPEEVEPAASPEPEAIAEDDPVVEEPASEAPLSPGIREDAADKSDEDAGWPLDEE